MSSVYGEGHRIIAVDFDGTLCTNAYPDCGLPNQKLFSYLIGEQKKGTKVILWTCRRGKPLKRAVEYCKDYGLVFDAVNERISPEKGTKWKDSRKVYADLYIDDRAVKVEW